jgi:hypothetical protein
VTVIEFQNSDTDLTLSTLLDEAIDTKEREALTRWLLHNDTNLYQIVSSELIALYITSTEKVTKKDI